MKEFHILYPEAEGSDSQNEGYLIFKSVFEILGIPYQAKCFGTLLFHATGGYYPCVILFDNSDGLPYTVVEFDLSQISSLLLVLKQ